MNEQHNKAKHITQEQLSSPLSQVLKTYDFGNFENCELILKLFDLSLTSILICTIGVGSMQEYLSPPVALCTSGTS